MKKISTIRISILISAIVMCASFVNVISAQEQSKIMINSIRMNDFYKVAVSESEDSTLLITDNSKFSIVFYPKYKNQFLITLNPNSFEKNLKEAEDSLITTLGIPKYQACWLNIVVSAPANVEKNIDSRSQRPSFCQGKGHADLNGDGTVNTLDFAACLKQTGVNQSLLSCDFDYSHKVDAVDRSELLQYIGQTID